MAAEEVRRFGVGERVRYAMDWPQLDDEPPMVLAGTLATVLLVPPGPCEMYLVALDTSLPNIINEMSVNGRYLVAE